MHLNSNRCSNLQLTRNLFRNMRGRNEESTFSLDSRFITVIEKRAVRKEGEDENLIVRRSIDSVFFRAGICRLRCLRAICICPDIYALGYAYHRCGPRCFRYLRSHEEKEIAGL